MARIAVVGAGYWGKNLLRNFNQLGALQAICESNPQNSNLAPYFGIKTYDDYGALLEDYEIDAVAICTPAVMHYEMSKMALESGKHVYVEKPLCLSEKEGMELNALAKTNGLVLMVGHLLQYHPAFLKMKELIDKGELGKIQYIYSNRLNLGKIRREENILWSFAPHDISMILSLAGEMPNRVSTTGGKYLNAEIADVTLSSLSFSNGINAHIFVSWLHPYKEQKLIVVGEKGMTVFDDVANTPDKLLVFPHKIDWKEGNIPVPVKESAVRVAFEAREPLQEECKHFAACVDEKRTPRTDGEEGLRVLRVLNAFQRSLESNGKVIRLDQPAKNFFIHETAVLDERAEIGEGTSIWHFSHILNKSRIGRNCKIGQNVVIGPNAVVGNGVKIQNNVSVYEGVTLEDNVFCGPSMVFTNVFNPRSEIPRMHELRRTLVKKGATIGANATIVCGTTIGRYALIGAGSVVNKDVPDYGLVVGNPGKLIGWVCRCGTTLRFNADHSVCAKCGNEYGLANDQLLILKETI
jgi:UDP-2-acetamido-3-amino-2,3-dideoxy-glucuronate N-acetyltransferase